MKIISHETYKPRLDWDRIRHLMKIGIMAAVMVLAGDMLLGWGKADMTASGMQQYFSRYLTVSDSRIFWSALLGLIGIPVECMSWAAIYRLIVPYSSQQAHAYRAGLIGMLITGALVHVMCCASVFHYKTLYALNDAAAVSGAVRFAKLFLLPAVVIMTVFFLLTAAVQIAAFVSGNTPYPRWCWVFTILSGFIVIAVTRLFGNNPLAYALSTGWISIGNIWMMAGLLIMSRKLQKGE